MKPIHIKKFDGGRRTPQEYHREFAFPPTAKCSGCQAKPAIRAITLMSAKDAEKRGLIPQGAAGHPAIFPAVAPVAVALKGSDGKPEWFIRISLTYSCTMCQPAFEKALAALPSWVVTEINSGPDARNRVSVGAS